MLPETRALSSGRYAGAAVAIVALAAVLRFYKLGEWSMWVDEGMTYVRAATGNLSDQGPLYATAPLNFLVKFSWARRVRSSKRLHSSYCRVIRLSSPM